MVKNEVAIDGGKNLSMVVQAWGETIKAPSNLVISTYVTCLDITKTITPNFKVCYCPQNPAYYLIFKWHYDVGMLDTNTWICKSHGF
jgi:hypothetical protein